MLKSRNHHKHGDRKCKRCLTNLYLQYNLDIRLQMLLTKYYLIRLAPLPAKQTLVRRRSSVISRNCSWEEHLPHSFRLNDWQDYSRCTLDSQTNVQRDGKFEYRAKVFKNRNIYSPILIQLQSTFAWVRGRATIVDQHHKQLPQRNDKPSSVAGGSSPRAKTQAHSKIHLQGSNSRSRLGASRSVLGQVKH